MSVHLYGSRMEREEAVEYLQETGVGTLAFGSEAGGYALPMSFGYDGSNDTCVFQFAFDEGSEKWSYIETGNPVTLCVHSRESVDDWKSVLVRGPLEPIPSEEQTRASAIFASQAKVASTDVFQKPMQEIEFGWYRIDIEEITGRTGTVD